MADVDENGIAKDSPLNIVAIPLGTEFDFQTDRGAIRKSKIRDFNFSSGFGGTLTLGGTANGNGVMLIKDASGSTVVTANNTGITINGGSINIYDTSGSIVIDSLGVRSNTQFITRQVLSNTPQDATGTAWTTATGSSFTITTTREIRVLFNVLTNCKSENEEYILNGRGVDTNLYDSFLGTYAIYNQTNYGFSATRADITDGVITGFTYNSAPAPFSISAILSVAAGTHNYELQFRPYSGGTAGMYSYLINLVVLGT